MITKVQRKTPNENLGKVIAIIITVAQCAAPLGQFVYGMVFESFSAVLYLPIFVASLLVFTLSVMTQRILRNEVEEVKVM